MIIQKLNKPNWNLLRKTMEQKLGGTPVLFKHEIYYLAVNTVDRRCTKDEVYKAITNIQISVASKGICPTNYGFGYNNLAVFNVQAVGSVLQKLAYLRNSQVRCDIETALRRRLHFNCFVKNQWPVTTTRRKKPNYINNNGKP